MTIYTIIVTYNAMHRRWIDRCMKSLHDSTIATIAIIIDNGSTDGTRDYVPKHYPDAIWMPQDKNLGFGQANNVGIRYALEHDADYVLLLNQDAAISPDAIEKMLAASDGESLLSPLHLNGEGTRIDELFRYSLRDAHNLMNDDLLIRHTLANSYETGEICAACWLMPISLIKKIGGFNPLFFHYSEDNNYYHRMVYHGAKTILVPNVYMYHDRVLMGNVKAYNKRRLHRDLLVIVCNINKGLFRRIAELIRQLFRNYFHELPKHQYIPGSFMIEIFWLIAHLGAICQSRRKEKKVGPSWL